MIIWNVFRLQIFCRRQSLVVRKQIQTAEADATQTRQFCRVWLGDVNQLWGTFCCDVTSAFNKNIFGVESTKFNVGEFRSWET